VQPAPISLPVTSRRCNHFTTLAMRSPNNITVCRRERSPVDRRYHPFSKIL